MKRQNVTSTMSNSNENPFETSWSLQCDAAVALARLSDTSSSSDQVVSNPKDSKHRALAHVSSGPFRKRRMSAIQSSQISKISPHIILHGEISDETKSIIQMKGSKSQEISMEVQIRSVDTSDEVDASVTLLDETFDRESRSSVLKRYVSYVSSEKKECTKMSGRIEEDHEGGEDEVHVLLNDESCLDDKATENISLPRKEAKFFARGNQTAPNYGEASASFRMTYDTGQNINLEEILGPTESPIIALYNSATQRNIDIDKDALTEILLKYHHKKLSLRMSLLSDMVHVLSERKRQQVSNACEKKSDENQQTPNADEGNKKF